ncbi:acyl-CoA N-acyltransferase [Lentinus tigrinus ALCF2SS1-7]|uniref:Acyl-CoA N-acyltransferase n=1 Tax=Lentinus tigrinus ALCF2SS1-6 TaxID=1328759 RepID=A0A5C2SNT9_9APHY|nr:acyl-CoA N-acyltransferase [Lentinus tigrinus ALCF2SS1-6]RPD79158.1 acyl-CoA N-acyltransferase [Lentinus tigrinus ALCF2SS1-7]
MSIFYDLVFENELEEAHRLESQGYPEDEAGSLETFRYRQSQSPELFLGAYIPSADGTGRTLIGYVCSTLSPDTTLTHESMSKHVPGSKSVCIHSVCVAPQHRRKHVALNLLKDYIRRLEEAGKYDRVLLIAHEELRGLYEKAGFEWDGLSAVVHGSRPWFEMRKDLTSAEAAAAPDASAQAQGQALPAGLWEALAHQSTRTRPVPRLLTFFAHAVEDVTNSAASDGSPTNKYDLLCPRLGCGSIILKAGVAQWVERASVQLEPAGSTIPDCLGVLPAPPNTAQWWLITPNAMVFENIGFSRPVQTTGGNRLKLLACAECDLGPLGWCEEGGSEFWLACNRVGYRA